MDKNKDIGKVTNTINTRNNVNKKNSVSKKRIIFIIAIAIFSVYCIILLVKLLRNPTDTFIVENGKIYKEETASGCIIRDEHIVEDGENAGEIVQLKTEGKKVANGEAIYRDSLENESELKQKVEELDKKIQVALQSENNIFSSDIKLLEAQIEGKLESVYENTNIQQIEQYKKEINNDMTKKAKMAGELTANGSYVKQLIQERSEYEKQLNDSSKYVISDRSGIISYRIDDYENKLTVGDFSYLNKEFLNSVNLKSGQIVAANNNKAKIVNNFKCYIACVSKTEEAKESEVGNSVKIRIPNAEEIPAKIVHKASQSDDETLLVFEVTKCVENMIDYRKMMFDIIWWSDSGLKVPNSAINYEGKFAYVIRNRAGYEEKILVKVLRQNENYSIVENYSTAELEEAGYDTSLLDNKKSIGIYDEIVVKNQ